MMGRRDHEAVGEGSPSGPHPSLSPPLSPHRPERQMREPGLTVGNNTPGHSAGSGRAGVGTRRVWL